MQHAEVLQICYAFLFDIKGLPKTTAEQSARGYAHSLWRVWDEKCSNERPSEPEGETPRAWFHGHRVANRSWMPKKCKATIHHLVLLVWVDLEGHGLLVCDGQFGPSRNKIGAASL